MWSIRHFTRVPQLIVDIFWHSSAQNCSIAYYQYIIPSDLMLLYRQKSKSLSLQQWNRVNIKQENSPTMHLLYWGSCFDNFSSLSTKYILTSRFITAVSICRYSGPVRLPRVLVGPTGSRQQQHAIDQTFTPLFKYNKDVGTVSSLSLDPL